MVSKVVYNEDYDRNMLLLVVLCDEVALKNDAKKIKIICDSSECYLSHI